jgi:toxin HigB-1
MIKTFRHKGLETFFKTGGKAGIQAAHAKKLRILLTALDNAKHLGGCPRIEWSTAGKLFWPDLLIIFIK